MKKTMILLAGTVLLGSIGLAQAAEKLKAEVFTSWTSGGEGRALEAIKKEFEKRGGVWESSTIAGFENANAAFQNRLVAGDPPTAKQVVVGKDPAEFIEQGLMNPIDDVGAAGKWKDVLPKALYDYMTYDGKVYLTPTGIHGESWMFYSKDVFSKAGIAEEPKDWDAFFADMDKLKAAGLIPIAWGGQAWQEAKVFNMILLSQVGMDGFMKIYADQDKTVLASDGIKKTLEIFGKMRGYVDEGAPGRNWNDATAMVITGKAGVQFMGDWAKGEFTAAGKVAGKDFGCAISPASPGLIYIADAFGYLKTNDPNQDAAQKLLAEVVMGPAVQVEFSLNKGSIPTRTDIDKSKFDICTQKGMTYLSEGKIVPEQAITITPQQVGTLTDFIDEFWANPSADIDASAAQFAAAFE
ncbi:carbohydrate ABC transporter substrate-binding protein [Rhizobium sp. CG5]|uniref:ABC transporter substrate-binding protein n=1 Tax=Rhizobium sp. CG5 TaxID=2726076 RepID=UPI0020332840|nr:ABC transporter substrate-binding protein [Rhizobium sp. CG5]MCM2476448.1 carbohydrate ABC transporter substrate-binding protein [Rhizobium sp. CG5]